MAAQAGPEWVGDFISGSSYKTLTHEIIHGAFLSPFAGPWCPKYVSSLTHDKKHGFIALLICCVINYRGESALSSLPILLQISLTLHSSKEYLH